MKRYFGVAFILIATASAAQPNLTLTDAINLALKNNYDIQIAKSNADINTTKGFIF